MFQHLEPFSGWVGFYNQEADPRSPFHGVEHSLFEYNRFIYAFEAHPQWDSIESENLLVKLLFVQYEEGYAILELLGEWNDLHANDFRLLRQYVIDPLVRQGIVRFILICENVFNAYLGPDEYYSELMDELEEGWLVVFRARPQVQNEFREFGIDQFVFWSDELDMYNWRKGRPWQLFEAVNQRLERLLPQ